MTSLLWDGCFALVELFLKWIFLVSHAFIIHSQGVWNTMSPTYSESYHTRYLRAESHRLISGKSSGSPKNGNPEGLSANEKVSGME